METDERPPGPEPPRAHIEFLANSWHRLDVLDTIATAPRTRHELRELTEVSRVTLSRILSDLEDQGWIARENDTHHATPAGGYVASEITNLLDNLHTLDRFDEHVNWMPLDQFEFDLCHLHDAEVITPTWDDFSAYTSTLVELVYESSTIKGIGTGLDREFVQALIDATMSGDLSLELIYEPDVIDAITADDDLARLFRDLADVEHAAVYRYQGTDPLMMLGLHEMDDDRENIVMLCGEHEEGAPPGTVQTTEPAVWSWAEDYFEARRGHSHQVRAAVFTP